MTTRRVHFSPEVERTPSPSFSNSSAPSSPALRTPPTYPAHIPAGPYIASPTFTRGHARTPSPLSLSSLEIHAVLCAASHQNPVKPQPLIWKVTVDPALIRAPHPYSPQSPLQYALSSDVLAQPATMPAMGELTIISSELPWKVEVKASNGTYVTVQDVLHAVYRNLRTPMSDAELTLACKNPKVTAAAVDDAYKLRYRSIRDPNMRQVEKDKGCKRVDVLMKSVTFAGLSPTDKHNVLNLHLR